MSSSKRHRVDSSPSGSDVEEERRGASDRGKAARIKSVGMDENAGVRIVVHGNVINNLNVRVVKGGESGSNWRRGVETREGRKSANERAATRNPSLLRNVRRDAKRPRRNRRRRLRKEWKQGGRSTTKIMDKTYLSMNSKAWKRKRNSK